MSGTTIHQFTGKLINELQDQYPEQEIRQFGKMLLQHVLKVNNTQLLMMNMDLLDDTSLTSLNQCTKQLKQHIPIQYIIGSTEFYGLQFKVNPAVLIPRPETEELVEWIIADNCKQCNNLLDIGTGSGCIAISLKAHMPDTDITAFDISGDAIKTASENARLNQLNVNFEQQDILSYQAGTQKFDCIVSNPPYVRELEKEMMETNVLDHEPHTALFVSDNDPLIFYRTIAELGLKMLTTNGHLYFEINEYLAKEMTELLISLGYSDVTCRKDINGKDRMMKAQKR